MSGTAAAVRRSVGGLVAWAEAELRSVADAPKLEALLLLGETTGYARAALLAAPERNVDPAAASRFEALVARRRRGEPYAYLVGRREFYSLRLRVTPAVLVPRPETETLVEAALARIPRANASVLDLGTGSGAIALALKHERPDLTITAVDSDGAALDVARANAAAHAIDIRCLGSDWYSALAGQVFDLIVSNPPYVRSRDPHFDGALRHEPRVALDGGAGGLDAHRAILRGAPAHLAPGGRLIVEHGFDQREAIVRLAPAGLALESVVDDLAGLPRVACFRTSVA
jgi:release factor glutamine methyltransferase